MGTIRVTTSCTRTTSSAADQASPSCTTPTAPRAATTTPPTTRCSADGVRARLSRASGHNGATLDTATSGQGNTRTWSPDAVGNSSSSTANGVSTSRTTNSRNELTALGSAGLTYDNDGNVKTDQSGNSLQYDAWNELTSLTPSSGSAALSQYDANGEVIQDSKCGVGFTDHYYDSTTGQDIEDRAYGTPTTQNVWNLGYTNDLLLRDSASSLPTSGLLAYGLDHSFNFTGVLVGGTGSYDGMAVQPADGKIVTAGVSGSSLIVSRYQTGGSLDTTFGSSGTVTVSLSSTPTFTRVALQSNGQIDVAVDQGSSVLVYRFNASGSADTYFGTSGVATISFGTTVPPFGLAIQSDGKIVVCGTDTSSNGIYLARLTSSGAMDSTFGTSGIVTANAGSRPNAGGLAIEADGKILVSGDNGSVADVVRFNTNGTLDTTFGSSGVAVTTFANFSSGETVAVAPDGKIVIGGFSYFSGTYHDILARFTSAGALDTTFGTGGMVLGGASSGVIRAIVIETNGGIFAAGDGGATAYQAAWKFTSSGTPTPRSPAAERSPPTPALPPSPGRSLPGPTSGWWSWAAYSGDVAMAVFAPAALRLYAQHDAVYNVTALVDTFGNVDERFIYDPYGTVTVLSPSWTTTTDAYGWTTLFQGMRLNAYTGLYHTLNREYSATLGRWMQADPAGYVNGSSLYESLGGSPTNLVDPSGTVAIADDVAEAVAAVVIGTAAYAMFPTVRPAINSAANSAVQGISSAARSAGQSAQKHFQEDFRQPPRHLK